MGILIMLALQIIMSFQNTTMKPQYARTNQIKSSNQILYYCAPKSWPERWCI